MSQPSQDRGPGPSREALSAAPTNRPGLVQGLRSLLAGLGFMLRTPRAWPLAAVPVVVLTLVTTLLSAGAIYWLPGWIERLVGPTGSTWGSVGAGLLQVLGTLAAVLISALVGLSLAQPLSGPALEAIVRLQERELGAPARPTTSFLVDVGRSLKSLLVGYAFGLPPLALLFAISLLVPPAAVVTTPLKLVVVAFMIGWDLCDYPLTVQGLRIRDRVTIMWRYRSAVLGFGVALALATLVPCLLFLLLPAGVAGAGRLMWSIERWEQTQGRAWHPVAPAVG